MEERIKIKICGITRKEEIDMLNEAGVDYAGFVFYEKSKRCILPEKAAELKEALAPSIKSVAVTVSPDAALIKRAEALGFDIIQIHGRIYDDVLDRCGIPAWIAVNADSIDEAEKAIKTIESSAGYNAEKIKAFVFDAPMFGSGKTSDWSEGRRPDTKKMFVLAGGLDDTNVTEGIRIFTPDVVDVSSSVEGKDGKDRERILSFTYMARKGDIK